MLGFQANKDCVEAFKDLEIDINELYKNGLKVGGAGVLRSNTDGIKSGFIDYSKSLIGSSSVKAFTLLKSATSAFVGGGVSAVLAHEMIHAGGWRAKNSYLGSIFNQHDLSYLKGKHDRVIEKCSGGGK